MKSCMGHKSRTDAARALSEQGLSPPQIAAAMSDATGEVITPKAVSDLLDSLHRHAVGRRARLVLPLDMRARRFRIGEDSGETFDDDDFDGLTLTIEVFSASEARAVLKAITKTVAAQQT